VLCALVTQVKTVVPNKSPGSSSSDISFVKEVVLSTRFLSPLLTVVLSHLCYIQRRILNLSSARLSIGVSLLSQASLIPAKSIFTRETGYKRYCTLKIPTQEKSRRKSFQRS